MQAYDAHVAAEFSALQTTLISQTEQTRSFFDKLVEQLQKGMEKMADDFKAEPFAPASGSASVMVIDSD